MVALKLKPIAAAICPRLNRGDRIHMSPSAYDGAGGPSLFIFWVFHMRGRK